MASCCTGSEPKNDRRVDRASLGAVALGLLVIGGWFFETLFRTGEPPVDVGDGWPVIVIAIGAIVVLIGLFGGRGDEGAPAAS